MCPIRIEKEQCMVNFIRSRVLNNELLFGLIMNLGSSLTVEMAGAAGYDWLWVDGEHGMGGFTDLVHQLQAASATPAAPVVRVVWNDFPLIKRVLDMGASGVIVPWINRAEDAAQVVRAMRYPPQGIRGVARLLRGNAFGFEFDEYFARANQDLLTAVQIETAEAIANADDIAAVEGVDALVIGPTDLSTSMGIFGQFSNPLLWEAFAKVAAACKAHGKAAGILLPALDDVDRLVEMGFRFIATGADGSLLANSMHANLKRCHQAREKNPGK
jgi:4-hydroxy-2-oxoheptanedioate aldolase